MEENSSVSEHILRMSGYHNHMTQLGVNTIRENLIHIGIAVARSRKGAAATLATVRSEIHAAAIAISSSAGPLYALLLGWASQLRPVQT